MNKKLIFNLMFGMIFLFGIIIFTPQINAFDWTNGTVSYYTLDELSGNMIDTPGSNDGTNNAGVFQNQAGKLNTAYFFNNTGRTTIATSTTLDLGSDFTYSWWNYHNGTAGTSTVYGRRSLGTDNGQILIATRNNYLEFRIWKSGCAAGDTSELNSTITLTANTWEYITVTYNDATNNLTFYKNGNYVNNIVNAFEICSGRTDPSYFGEMAYGTSRGIRIDEFGIWNRTLSGSEVSQLYNKGNGLSYGESGTSELSVVLNFPSDNYPFYETDYRNLTINISATAGQANSTYFYNLTNISLYTNITGVWQLNKTITLSGTNNTWVTFNITLPTSGNVSWGGEACNTNEDCDVSFTNRTLKFIPIFFTLCNATYNQPYINFTFLDEQTLSELNATIDSSTWVYYLGDGSFTKEYVYSNTTENSNYAFCFSSSNRILHNTRTVQYSSTSYPQRKYDASTDLTNSTLNQTLYLLSSADGIYSTIQVVDQNGNRIPGVEVVVERQFSGVYVVIGQETTDDSGSVTFWLNPDYDHRFTFEIDSCSYIQTTIRPTQTQYTQALSCTTGAEFVSNLEGIKYARTPAEGILPLGLTNFTYQVVSSKDNIIGASFQIVNASTGTVLNSTSSSCTSSGCTLSFLWNVTKGSDIKGKYYVNIGNGSLLLEASAHWIAIDIDNGGKAGFGTFFTDLSNLFKNWGTDSNEEDFNRLVTIFFILALAIAALNYHLGTDSVNPGAFLIFLFAFILLGSILGNLFYFNNLSSSEVVNNYILVFMTGIIMLAYFLNVNRLAQR